MKKIPIINQIIKDKRKELKITQEDFTKIINKGIATVRRYDTGYIITENTLILISDKLNLDIFDLLEQQKKENQKNNTDFYSELIEKYFYKNIENIDNSLKNKKIEDLKYYGDKLGTLYSILYNDFFITTDTEKTTINLYMTDENVESFDYICVQDFNTERNIIKERIFFKDNSVKEKVIDSFTLAESFVLLQDLEQFFSTKILINRKTRLLGSYKKRIARIKKYIG